MAADGTDTAERDRARSFDMVIVGAGFAGLYMLLRARRLGLSARVYEAGEDVGGTWYWNRYPGARCDIESMQYSFGFDDDLQQEWRWSEHYSTQPEILKYAGHVADRYDLRPDIRFATRVGAVRWDDPRGVWRVSTDRGDDVEGRFLVMATGCLSAARRPDIEGIDDFRGATYHTGEWPHEGVDFSGLDVAVIGTGSSAIQSIPEIARQAKHLTVFQRTPNFSVPARNVPMSPDYEQTWKAHYPEKRAEARRMRSGVLYEFNERSALEVSEAERRREYEWRWEKGGTRFLAAFNDLLLDQRANDTAAGFVREKIREIVKDPATAEILAPDDHPLGTKRICVDTGYYETFNRDNVAIVDLKRTPLRRITATGIETSERSFAFDAIVYATGFDAMTGALNAIDIEGRGGERLRDKWAEGPRAYLGLMSAGFPNLFMVTGPGSPSVLSNMIVSIEQHVDFIADAVAHLQGQQADLIEASRAAEDAWVEHVNRIAGMTLFPKAASWYMGANIPGKPRVFMPYIGVAAYHGKCRDVVAKGYQGFRIAAAGRTVTAAAE